MPSQQDIASQMVQMMNIAIPGLDTTIGSVPRKIVDVVAQQIAQGYVDNNILRYSWDISSKTGADLDNFVGNFGFGRVPARRATGTVTFLRQTGFQNPSVIPQGTQVGTATAPPITFATTVPTLVQPGATQALIPIQALVGGISGNVGPGAITNMVSPIGGIATITNTAATTGGADAESDASLRQRFLTTIFRSLVGTEQMFLGTALEDPDAIQANVIGAEKFHRESIELVASATDTVGTAHPDSGISTVVNAKYIYNDSSVTFGPDIDNAQIVVPNVGYSFAVGPPDAKGNYHPILTTIDLVNVPINAVYDLQFAYVPHASRNDPANGITNRIDVYVAGSRATEATQTALFRRDRAFVNTVGVALQQSKFLRADQFTKPTLGNFFIPLAFAPVINPALDNQIIINGVTYNQDPGLEYTVQTLSITGAPTGGTFTLTLEGLTTAAIAYNATAATVQAALQALALSGSSGIVCGGGPLPGTPITITLGDQAYPGLGVGPLTATSSLTGGTTPAISVVPSGPQGDFWLVDDVTNEGGTYQSLSGIEFLSVANGSTKAQQLQVASGTVTAGTFTLTWTSPGGSPQTTAALNWNATATQIQQALANLLNIGQNNIAVTGGPLPTAPFIITFIGAFTTMQPLITVTNSLTGGTYSVVAVDPPDLTSFPVDYSFNSIPRDVAQNIFAWREVTTDVEVHQAKQMYLNLYLAVILQPGMSLASVTPSIQTAVEQYVGRVGFDQVLQVSDIIGTVNAVGGISACRFTTNFDGDAAHYAWQQVSPSAGNPLMQTFAVSAAPDIHTGDQTMWATDIYLPDDTVPVLNSLVLKQVALNTFGVV